MSEENGRATSFEGVEDAAQEKSRWQDILLDRIKPSIDPKIDLVPIPGSTKALMVFRVEPGGRGPYAYTTREQAFVVTRRSGDRLRPVSWSDVLAAARSAPTEELLESAGKKLDDRIDRIQQRHVRQPIWFFLALPVNPRFRVRIDDAQIRRGMEDPRAVGIRRDGWTFWTGDSAQLTQDGFETGREVDVRGGGPYRHLKVLRNGIVEFLTGLDSFEWGPSAREGKDGWSLYPYTVTEVPVSLLRLLAYLYQNIDPQQQLMLQAVFFGLEGSTLAPYGPGALFVRSDLKRFSEPTLYCPREPLTVTVGEVTGNADRIAFRLVRNLYEAFGYEEKMIPFYEPASGRFVF